MVHDLLAVSSGAIGTSVITVERAAFLHHVPASVGRNRSHSGFLAITASGIDLCVVVKKELICVFIFI